MIAAREDPFAIQVLIQSADKVLIDISKKTGKKLALDWLELIKPEYKKALIEIIREPFNCFKHADKDHDQLLPVGKIAELNVMMLTACMANYQALFGDVTNHMLVIFSLAKIVAPGAFFEEGQFEKVPGAAVVENMTATEFFDGLWTDPLIAAVYPNLHAERDEDVQDTFEFYNTNLSLLRRG